MRASDSKKLRVGDRVQWNGTVGGEVIDTGYHALTVRWDDGQTGTTDHRDAQSISREPAATSHQEG